MHKVGILGDHDSVIGFKAVGVDTFPCISTDEAKKTLLTIAEEEYAVIFITEAFAKEMLKELDQYKKQQLPVIVPIPGIDGSYGIGLNRLRKSVERAVGSDILFGGGSQ